MDMLRGNTLTDKQGKSVLADTALTNVQYVLYFFSASWCPAGVKFLPKLIELCKGALRNQMNIQIIYIPGDRDKTAMVTDFKSHHGDWYVIPHDSNLNLELRFLYNVTSLPRLIVVKITGELITENGVSEVENLGTLAALGTWKYEAS